jgi:hypothetical protein
MNKYIHNLILNYYSMKKIYVTELQSITKMLRIDLQNWRYYSNKTIRYDFIDASEAWKIGFTRKYKAKYCKGYKSYFIINVV